MVKLNKLSKMRLFLFALLALTGSCKKDIMRGDDELSIQKMSYTGNQLRTDGYYYQKANASFFSIYFFYNNGIILSAGGVFSNETELEDYIDREFLRNQSYKNSKITWGVFGIDGNIIKFERWYPSQPPLKAFVREGEILNDTTFVIAESYRVVDGQRTAVTQRNEVYHFKEFNPKPDSTNSFVQ